MRPFVDRDLIKSTYEDLGRDAEATAAAVGCGLHLVARVVSGKDEADRAVEGSRHASIPLDGRNAKMPPFDHPAIMEGRTLYPTTVTKADGAQRVLKSGVNQPKIGGEIRKGKWSGFPVYQLTLEERKTCPTDCVLWRGCYGNKMHWSPRFAPGKDLEDAIRREVAELSVKHPRGFAVRLHVLGDFYSTDYVDMWRRLILIHDELHVWGYTRRYDIERDPIARDLVRLISARWDRFAVRMSDAPLTLMSTSTIDHPYQAPEDSIVCPEQYTPSKKRAESCSACALCWTSTRRIAFIRH